MPRHWSSYPRLMQARLQTGGTDPIAPLEILPQAHAETACARDEPGATADFAVSFARLGAGGPATSMLSGAHKTRQAVLLLFSDPIPGECLRLWLLSYREWPALLQWLDISGLALYFLARVREKELEPMLPPHVRRRLRQNLADNARRTASMLAESTEIQRGFQLSGLHYAVLKGFSLWPHSVPRHELRSQLDLDYLIAERDAPEARRLLESHGYHLHAISGRSWEFKTDAPPSSLARIYCSSPNRSVELHLEAPHAPSALSRIRHVPLSCISMPVLPPVDLFLGQGLHLYKHVCSEFYRPAHLLEFRRHVLARSADADFWDEVRERGERSLRTSLALGVITLLIERTMGPFAPNAFTSWTIDRLPRSLRAWIDRYGVRSAVMSFSGNKLYLLLQQEMESLGIDSRRSVRQALVPRRLPPAISHAAPDETLRARAHRHFFQARFVLRRLRFHLVAGIGYLREARRWRQFLASELNSLRMTKQ